MKKQKDLYLKEDQDLIDILNNIGETTTGLPLENQKKYFKKFKLRLP